MSLRDWFAGMAMLGTRANCNMDLEEEHLARLAYAAADAMMKTRETKP
jgi:hypothetical protein